MPLSCVTAQLYDIVIGRVRSKVKEHRTTGKGEKLAWEDVNIKIAQTKKIMRNSRLSGVCNPRELTIY